MASSIFSVSSLGPLASIAPYHTMLFGTLLGTEVFQVRPTSTDATWVQAKRKPDLRHDQSVLSRTPNVRLHHIAETRIPRIFPPPNRPLPFDRPHASSARPCVSRVFTRRLDTAGVWWSYGYTQPVGLGPEGAGGDEGQDTSR